MRAMLEVEDVSVRFGKFRAVDDVTLSLAAGDLLGLVGPNGAGKTTLLRVCAGLLRPGRGRVRVVGEELADAGSRRVGPLSRVGFTADVPGVYGELTPRQFLAFVGRAYGIVGDELEEKTAFWLEKLWLADKADDKIRGLSRGMTQRIGLARTLLPGPEVVLLDEPAAGLDPAGRVAFRRLLVMLREQGAALIVSSHILSDMPEYCTHIGLMKKGRLLRLGTVAEVADDEGGLNGAAPTARYTLELVGDHDVTTALGLLTGRAGVGEVQRVGTALDFDAPADRGSAAALLAEVTAAGAGVCGFRREAEGLEAAYLRAGLGEVD